MLCRQPDQLLCRQRFAVQELLRQQQFANGKTGQHLPKSVEVVDVGMGYDDGTDHTVATFPEAATHELAGSNTTIHRAGINKHDASGGQLHNCSAAMSNVQNCAVQVAVGSNA